MNEKRSNDQFSGSFGMLAAAIGSAVGLGNLWRFPYLVGQQGGAAFIIVYLAISLVISTPILLAEMVIGRRGGGSPQQAYVKVGGSRAWGAAGVLGMLACFTIISFYVVVGGWTVRYLIHSLMMEFDTGEVLDSVGVFTGFIGSDISPIFYALIFIGLTIAIINMGVQKGIEASSKLMMPLLFVLIVLIGIRSVTLPGAGEGLKYLFKPDFSRFGFDSLLAAMGQSFFSLSLGACMMVTYGAYTPRRCNLAKNAAIITISDTFFAILASCAILPAVFAFGINPGEGPGLVFVTLPQIFTQMPLGGLCSILFFVTLFLAALSSAVSLFEVVVSTLMGMGSGMQRKKASTIAAIALVVTGSLCSLSQGALKSVTLFGRNIFDLMDYVSANYMMTIGALLAVVCIGFRIKKEAFVDEVTSGGSVRVSRRFALYMFYVIKYVAPPVIAAIAISIIF